MCFEFVQEKGGFHEARRAFFAALMETCRSAGIRIWIDEAFARLEAALPGVVTACSGLGARGDAGLRPGVRQYAGQVGNRWGHPRTGGPGRALGDATSVRPNGRSVFG